MLHNYINDASLFYPWIMHAMKLNLPYIYFIHDYVISIERRRTRTKELFISGKLFFKDISVLMNLV